MICLMEGRHVHPSTIYPAASGRRDADAADRLPEPAAALPGLHQEGRRHERRRLRLLLRGAAGLRGGRRRRILLGCWGAFNNPDHVDYSYKNMDDWGNEMFVTPGVVVDGELVTTNLVDINLGIRILLGSRTTRTGHEEKFVPKDPLGNPVDSATRGTRRRSRSRRSATSTAATTRG
jgi:hydrogenase large subunit